MVGSVQFDHEARNVYAHIDVHGKLVLQTSANSGYKHINHKTVRWTKKLMTEMGVTEPKDVTPQALLAHILENNELSD